MNRVLFNIIEVEIVHDILEILYPRNNLYLFIIIQNYSSTNLRVQKSSIIFFIIIQSGQTKTFHSAFVSCLELAVKMIRQVEFAFDDETL